MPTITISDTTYAKLQALVTEPFSETPDSVVASLAVAELERQSLNTSNPARPVMAANEILRLNPDSHENLAHSRLRSASVDNEPIHRPKWNSIHEHMHILAHKKLGSLDELRRVSGANLREGKFEENGYKYIHEANLSIQGVDSNLAWDHSLRLARKLSVSIEVTLEWRNKDGVAHPGKTAVLAWTPTAK